MFIHKNKTYSLIVKVHISKLVLFKQNLLVPYFCVVLSSGHPSIRGTQQGCLKSQHFLNQLHTRRRLTLKGFHGKVGMKYVEVEVQCQTCVEAFGKSYYTDEKGYRLLFPLHFLTSFKDTADQLLNFENRIRYILVQFLLH